MAEAPVHVRYGDCHAGVYFHEGYGQFIATLVVPASAGRLQEVQRMHSGRVEAIMAVEAEIPHFLYCGQNPSAALVMQQLYRMVRDGA